METGGDLTEFPQSVLVYLDFNFSIFLFGIYLAKHVLDIFLIPLIMLSQVANVDLETLTTMVTMTHLQSCCGACCQRTLKPMLADFANKCLERQLGGSCHIGRVNINNQ